MLDNNYLSLEKAYIKNLESLDKCNADKRGIINHVTEQEKLYVNEK